MSEPSDLAKAHSKIYMADVHKARRKKKKKKFKISRHPPPWGYGSVSRVEIDMAYIW